MSGYMFAQIIFQSLAMQSKDFVIVQMDFFNENKIVVQVYFNYKLNFRINRKKKFLLKISEEMYIYYPEIEIYTIIFCC